MTDAFTGRPLDQVIITDFTVGRSSKSTMIAGQIFVTLRSPTGKRSGPGIQVDVGTSIDLSTSLEDAERALLESALGLIRRIGEMDVDGLHTSWVEWSKRATVPQDV
jgi:hypothetical protein